MAYCCVSVTTLSLSLPPSLSASSTQVKITPSSLPLTEVNVEESAEIPKVKAGHHYCECHTHSLQKTYFIECLDITKINGNAGMFQLDVGYIPIITHKALTTTIIIGGSIVVSLYLLAILRLGGAKLEAFE
jgi:hypothetical protein